MIKPIYIYGHKVLKTDCEDITNAYPNLNSLIDSMYSTMEQAAGVGLAAPQIGLSINLFVVDGKGLAESKNDPLNTFRQVFINPTITKEYGDPWMYEEGCLSIPSIRENVSRHSKIDITYYDQAFNKQQNTFDGLFARIVQHEYDHLRGLLFTDKISIMRKRLLKNKLNKLIKGKVTVDYPVKFIEKK